MMDALDLVIVGAGPAGMGAALEARRHGLSVMVLDEQPLAGGQIYRAAGRARLGLLSALGSAYARGRPLIEAFARSGIPHEREADVWFVDPDGLIVWSRGGKSYRTAARRVIVATGAIERPLPFPGWTLPAVIGAGAAQIALKDTAAVVPDAVFAGSGPLLFQIVAQYLRLGVTVRAVIDFTSADNYAAAARDIGGALASFRPLATGLGLIARIRAAGVPIFFGASDLAALGDERVHDVTFRHRGHLKHLREIGALCVHWGVIPNIATAAATGCRREWDGRQLCWRIACDADGRTSEPLILVAGDAGRIVGANGAEASGRRAALAAALDLGVIDKEAYIGAMTPLVAAMTGNDRIRSFLDQLYRLREGAIPALVDTAVLCRCENITVGQAREFLDADGFDINQFKSQTRCGMGPCQGQICAPTLQLLATSSNKVGVMPPFRARTPIRPVRLRELAVLADEMENS